jgi:hypothetical protein
LESLLFLLGSVLRKLSLPVHVLDLSDDGIPDDVLVECEPAFAIQPDIEKIITFTECRAPFPRKGDLWSQFNPLVQLAQDCSRNRMT